MPLPVKVCTVSQFCCAYALRMSYQLTFINRHRSIASPTRSNMTLKNAIFPRIGVSCPPRKVNSCESSMQTLLFAMSGEHVGPFVRVPRAHHTVHEKRITLHVLFRGLTRARNGHRAKRRVVLVKYCLYHQVGVILVQLVRT